MPKSVAEKLLISPGGEVLVDAAEAALLSLLDPLPERSVLVHGIDRSTSGVAVVFVDDRAALDAALARVLPHLASARASWVVYPKGNRADINRDSIWARLDELGWTAVANVAVSEIWSAVRIKPRSGPRHRPAVV